MKITEKQLRKVIQESLQEMELSALEEEIVKEQSEDDSGDDDSSGDTMEEQVSGMGMGGVKSGGVGFAGSKPGMSGGGLGKLGPQFRQMVAKAKAGDPMAKKNAIAVAKANPGNAEMQAAVASLTQADADAASMKANPFKPTQTGMNKALGLAEAKEVIRQLVQEVLAEEAKKATAKKKMVAPPKGQKGPKLGWEKGSPKPYSNKPMTKKQEEKSYKK